MKTNVLLTPLVGLLTSCGSVQQYQKPLLFSAGGAALGSVLSDGQPEMAALGSLAGAAIGLGANASQEGDEIAAFQNGYEQARMDRVKRDYWNRKRSQPSPTLGDPLIYRYFEIPIPAHHKDGANFEAQTQTIEIVE